MGNQRSEREAVKRTIQNNRTLKAHEIAAEVGLIDAMGYDKAVEYVRRVRKDMKKSGEIHPIQYATDDARLEDITKLFELRQGEMSTAAAFSMLRLNCYYRLRSEDDDVHMQAINDTYDKNRSLQEPFPMAEAVRICEIALGQYMASIDPIKNDEAKRRGFIGAGLNYRHETFIQKLEITEDELRHMKSIRMVNAE